MVSYFMLMSSMDEPKVGSLEAGKLLHIVPYWGSPKSWDSP